MNEKREKGPVRKDGKRVIGRVQNARESNELEVEGVLDEERIGRRRGRAVGQSMEGAGLRGVLRGIFLILQMIKDKFIQFAVITYQGVFHDFK